MKETTSAARKLRYPRDAPKDSTRKTKFLTGRGRQAGRQAVRQSRNSDFGSERGDTKLTKQHLLAGSWSRTRIIRRKWGSNETQCRDKNRRMGQRTLEEGLRLSTTEKCPYRYALEWVFYMDRQRRLIRTRDGAGGRAKDNHGRTSQVWKGATRHVSVFLSFSQLRPGSNRPLPLSDNRSIIMTSFFVKKLTLLTSK